MLVVALLWASPANACSFLGPQEHVVDPESTDAVAPGAPELGEVTIARGTGPRGFILQSSTSCDDLGWIGVAIAAEDDVSAPEAIGYRAEVVEGVLPEGLTISEGAWRAADGGLSWIWIDEATDEQEPFDFTVSFVAVDEGGNESEAVELDLSDPGSNGCGCDGSGGRAGAGAALVSLLLARRRARSR